jgi:hypothetical protein
MLLIPNAAIVPRIAARKAVTQKIISIQVMSGNRNLKTNGCQRTHARSSILFLFNKMRNKKDEKARKE